MDDLIEEMLAQPPALVTNEELASYKAKAGAYTTNKIIERLKMSRIDWVKYTKEFQFDPTPETLQRIWNGAIDDRIKTLNHRKDKI